jgi:energy-converting hydrogenase Eha subunit H
LIRESNSRKLSCVSTSKIKIVSLDVCGINCSTILTSNPSASIKYKLALLSIWVIGMVSTVIELFDLGYPEINELEPNEFGTS